MIKFKSESDMGTPVVGIGLTHDDIKKLETETPMRVDLKELGFEGVLLIFVGENRDKIIRALRPVVGRDAIIK